MISLPFSGLRPITLQDNSLSTPLDLKQALTYFKTVYSDRFYSIEETINEDSTVILEVTLAREVYRFEFVPSATTPVVWISLPPVASVCFATGLIHLFGQESL